MGLTIRQRKRFLKDIKRGREVMNNRTRVLQSPFREQHSALLDVDRAAAPTIQAGNDEVFNTHLAAIPTIQAGSLESSLVEQSANATLNQANREVDLIRELIGERRFREIQTKRQRKAKEKKGEQRITIVVKR